MQHYIARQPIFDRQRKVIAYELLFRGSADNAYPYGKDPDLASTQLINDSLFVFGLEKLVGNKKMFVNVPRATLLQGVVNILPAATTVIEIPEDIVVDEALVEACKNLKRAGYLIALDDFTDEAAFEPLVEIADILKIDFVAMDSARREQVVRKYSGRGLKLLAEKVETSEDYKQAIALGFHYVQGYFFSRPEMMTSREIPAIKINYMRFLSEVTRSDLDYAKLEHIIKCEMSLSVKLLRYLNSSVFSWKTQITSIKQALNLLGEVPLKKWALLTSLDGLGEDPAPQELLTISLVRARFCELVGERAGLSHHQMDLFYIGMLSMVDAIMSRPMHELLREFAPPDDICDVLLMSNDRPLPSSVIPLRAVYEMVCAYEQGDWGRVGDLAGGISLPEDQIPSLYHASLDWAHNAYGG